MRNGDTVRLQSCNQICRFYLSVLPFKFSAVHLEEFLLNKLITMPLLVPAVLIGIRLSNKYIGAHCEICVDSFVSLGLKKFIV